MRTDTLEIGGVTWTRVASLVNSGHGDRHFVLIVDPDSGASVVQFGDGATGQRLPIGTVNLTPAYRSGLGEIGNRDSGLGTTLVEQLARVADVLAEMEDRLTEESYLATKRARRSRHARLLHIAVGAFVGIAVTRVVASLSRDDSLDEMSEMESLRLQMAMDRLSKLMSTISNLLKRASETAEGIAQNIK